MVLNTGFLGAAAVFGRGGSGKVPFYVGRS